MLILTRRIGETITIGDDATIKVTVLGVKYNQVKIGIAAPKQISVDREEVFVRKKVEGPHRKPVDAPVAVEMND